MANKAAPRTSRPARRRLPQAVCRKLFHAWAAVLLSGGRAGLLAPWGSVCSRCTRGRGTSHSSDFFAAL